MGRRYAGGCCLVATATLWKRGLDFELADRSSKCASAYEYERQGVSSC